MTHFTDNSALLSDSYKFTHWKQLPPGITKAYSYFESRGGVFPETVFFGLQYFLQQYLAGEFRINAADVQEAKEMCAGHFGTDALFNEAGWKHFLHDHFGKLPLRIKAVPEGTVVPTHNVLMTVENTCPKCWWMTNFYETLLVETWYPITVATQSREIKRVIRAFLEKTGDVAGLDFKLHDFGFRGVSSPESAGIGGGAHMTSFMGTDTFVALKFLRKHYGEKMAGFSVPASEHFTMTAWGRDNEWRAMKNMLEQFPTGIMACVSDSYDVRKACSEIWGGILKDKVLLRDGILVVRPDSGVPRDIVLEVVKLLGDAFGSTWNEKGYKVLHPKVRVIQGDGVNKDSIYDVLQNLAANGWSADNVAFGMGGALLQKLDRDTQKMAFKCSYVEGNTYTDHGDIKPGGAPYVTTAPWSREVYKDPVTDPGKASKRGRLALVKRNGTYFTQPEHLTKPEDNILQTVFEDGEIKVATTLAEVRGRAAL